MKNTVRFLLLCLFAMCGYSQSGEDQKLRIRLLIPDQIAPEFAELKSENIKSTAGKERPLLFRLESEKNEPVAVAILVNERIFDEAEALITERLIQHANVDNDYCVIASSGKARVLVDWKTSRQDLKSALDRIAKTKVMTGHSVIFDAIAMGMAKLAESTLKKKVLLIIGHGYDYDSKTKFSAVKDLLRGSEVVAYGIKVGSPNYWTRDEKLDKITEMSGGMLHSLWTYTASMGIDPPLAGSTQIDRRRPRAALVSIDERLMDEIVERLVFQIETTYLVEFEKVESPEKLEVKIELRDQKGKTQRVGANFRLLAP